MLEKMMKRVSDSTAAKGVLVFVLLGVFSTACSSATVIRSRPEGATVYMDGVRKGLTPYTHSDTSILGASKPLRLEKAGHRPLDTVIRKDEFKVGPCIGGVLVTIPFLWVLGYPNTYEFELEKL